MCLFHSFCFLILLCNYLAFYFFVHIPLTFENTDSLLFLFKFMHFLLMSDLCLGYNTRLSKQKTTTFSYLTLFRLIHSATQDILLTFGENLMYLIILKNKSILLYLSGYLSFINIILGYYKVGKCLCRFFLFFVLLSHYSHLITSYKVHLCSCPQPWLF